MAFDGKSLLVHGISTEHLITRIQRDGRVLAQFGDFADPRRFARANAEQDAIRRRYSESEILVLPNRNIALGFRYLPLVRLYSPAGVLLWEHVLSGQLVDGAEAMAAGKPGLSPPMTVTVAGDRLAPVCGGIARTARGNLVVALQNHGLVCLNERGRLVAQKRCGPAKGVLRGPLCGVAVLDGRIYFNEYHLINQSSAPLEGW